jgi:hypothetical protein
MSASMLRKLAWVYAAGFLGVFLVTHAPFLEDANGLSFGLFKIDPVDDFVHLLSGVAGVVVAAWALSYIPAFFKWVGILYMADAAVGMVVSRGLLDGSVFTQGPGSPDFSVTNWALNLPHIVIAGVALVIGFVKASRPAPRL